MRGVSEQGRVTLEGSLRGVLQAETMCERGCTRAGGQRRARGPRAGRSSGCDRPSKRQGVRSTVEATSKMKQSHRRVPEWYSKSVLF